MDNHDLVTALSELRFFGKVAAGVSHEIKNSLAVIKEKAGLAQDLLALAEKGRPLDLGRLKEMMEKIIQRVDLTDQNVKDLSRFSHSVDDLEKVFDLSETLLFIARLSERFARMKNVTLKAIPAPQQLQISSNPFAFQRLLSLFIDAAIAGAKGATVEISVHNATPGAEYRFTVPGQSLIMALADLPLSVQELVSLLNAQIIADSNNRATILRFPKIISG